MQIIFLGVQPKLTILKSPICTCYVHVSVRTQENNFVSKYFKIIFLSGNRKIIFMRGGVHYCRTYMYFKPQENCPMIVWGGMVLYMTLKRSSPLDFIFDACASASSITFLLVKLNICGCTLLQGKCAFSFTSYEPVGVLNSVAWME